MSIAFIADGAAEVTGAAPAGAVVVLGMGAIVVAGAGVGIGIPGIAAVGAAAAP